MKYKFGICGSFDFEEKSTGGQSVKTREFYFALCNKVGKENILILESTGYKKNPASFFNKLLKMLKQCEHVIIFPAQNGIKIFAPLCNAFKGKNKVHYCVIGGWLPQMAGNDYNLLKNLAKLNSILVETNVMKSDLEKLGLKNVHRLLNFKRLTPIHEVKECSNPIKLCYFSRVLKQKGIEDASEVVRQLIADGINCTFDIYGPVVDGYDAEFEVLKQKFTSQISYKGKIDPSQSIEVLKDYDIQIFPTLYKTEGIPGSIVDSFFAGLPVVSSKWNSFADVVNDRVTGIGFELGNIGDFKQKLQELILNPELIYGMKKNCIEESKKYMPQNVIEDFLSIVD
jgi:glycosyltransferase involved in cell wall biosynthesis